MNPNSPLAPKWELKLVLVIENIIYKTKVTSVPL